MIHKVIKGFMRVLAKLANEEEEKILLHFLSAHLPTHTGTTVLGERGRKQVFFSVFLEVPVKCETR